MTNQYGPWATLIDAGPNLQLSAFWRRRLTMLVPTSQTSSVLSRRSLLWLGAAGVLTGVLPTLRSTSAVADEEKQSYAGKRPSADTSVPGICHTGENKPLILLREAILASQNSLRSGRGWGTYKLFDGNNKLVQQYELRIVFDGEKYKIEFVAQVVPKDSDTYDRQIIICDGSAVFVSDFNKKRIFPVGAQGRVYKNSSGGIGQATQHPFRYDIKKLGAHLLDIRQLKKIESGELDTHWELLPDGKYRVAYDIRKATFTIEISPEYGYNVCVSEGFNKFGKRTGSRYQATWKKQADIWYVDSFGSTAWIRGERTQHEEIKYNEFQVNPRVSSNSFTLAALELPEGAKILDHRPDVSTRAYTAGSRKTAEKRLDRMVDELENLPPRY